MNLEENQSKIPKKNAGKPNENDEEFEDIDEFENETWGNQPGGQKTQEWVTDWDNKPRSDEFFNELKAFLLKK